MSFLDELRRELSRRGIRGRLARRIEAELADHLACDPAADVGAPAEIAERFAAELRVVRTRRASIVTFAALAVCAALLLAAGARNGSSSMGVVKGLSVFGALAFAQIAFVAGTLALVRGLRARTPGDLRLAQRRGAVALASGGLVALSLVGLGQLWGVVGVLPLLLAAVATRSAAVLTPVGDAPGLSADLPPVLRGHVRPVLIAAALVAVAGIVFQGVVFEGSGWEGVIRGTIEAGGLAIGVTALGRPLALLR
jgi:hypothetical protein